MSVAALDALYWNTPVNEAARTSCLIQIAETTRRGENTYYPTLYFPFPGMVGVSVEVLSGLGLGIPVLMSPPPACCGSWMDHWPAL
jgi:hypothetical protein